MSPFSSSVRLAPSSNPPPTVRFVPTLELMYSTKSLGLRAPPYISADYSNRSGDGDDSGDGDGDGNGGDGVNGVQAHTSFISGFKPSQTRITVNIVFLGQIFGDGGINRSHHNTIFANERLGNFLVIRRKAFAVTTPWSIEPEVHGGGDGDGDW